MPKSDQEVLAEIQEMIADQKYTAICARFLRDCKNPDELSRRRTGKGADITDLIKSGKNNLKGKIGVYATDDDAYVVFEDLFNYIKSKLETLYHVVPPTDARIAEITKKCGITGTLGETSDELRKKYITSVRVRFARNIAEFPFPTFMQLDDRKGLEKKITDSLSVLKGNLAGKYTTIGSLSQAERDQWVKDHLLFENKDTYLSSANFYDDWPQARGCYMTTDKTVMVWINEEDHIRVMSLEPQWNLRDVFVKVNTMLNHIDKTVGFAYNPKFGNLTSCPTNLGTGMRASVHINLGNLKKALEIKEIKELAGKYKLEVRGIAGENTGYEGDIFDVSNAERADVEPADVIETVINGTGLLAQLDQAAGKK